MRKTEYHINNAKIAIIKALHRLSFEQVAKDTGYSSPATKGWLANPGSKGYRRAPDEAYIRLKKLYSEDPESRFE